jgi:hypothetical protein
LEAHVQDKESASYGCATLFFCHRGAEEPVLAVESSKRQTALKKAFSTSSIPNEVASSSSIPVEDIDKDDKGDPFQIGRAHV